jgi:hypothetical protein
MRDAINNNPKVQLAVLAVLVLLAGVMILPAMMGKKSSSSGTTTAPAAATATAAPGAQPAAGAATGATGATDASGATGLTGAAPAASTVSPSALVPGPGLPRPVIEAWRHGEAVVLLIVRGHGIDDRLVSRSVRGLSVDSELAVFVVHAGRIARYSRITQGVAVGQVPALIVIRPRRVSGSVPEAQVTYGFRDSRTVVQYVHDALYSGKDDLPYSPR